MSTSTVCCALCNDPHPVDSLIDGLCLNCYDSEHGFVLNAHPEQMDPDWDEYNDPHGFGIDPSDIDDTTPF